MIFLRVGGTGQRRERFGSLGVGRRSVAAHGRTAGKVKNARTIMLRRCARLSFPCPGASMGKEFFL